MGKTYRRDPFASEADRQDFVRLVQRSAARRQARKLAQLAWGDAAIADQGYRLPDRAPTR